MLAWVILSTHPLYKMATISQTTFHNAFSWMKMLEFQFSLKFVPKGPIALVHVMACRLFGAEPLPEPMLSQFIDGYMRH